MKATVDQDLCVGCGVCVGLCPEVFAMLASDKAEVTREPVPPAHEADVRAAADACPVAAIGTAA